MSSLPSRPRRTAPLRGLLALLVALGPVAAASAQLSVNLVGDGTSLAGAVALAAISTRMPSSTAEVNLDIAQVNGFDRLAAFPYSRGVDRAADVTLYTGMALPLALALLMPGDQAGAAGVIYLEVIGEAFFAKNAGKYLFPRPRPYLYFPSASGSGPADPTERYDSFPSGHATMACAAAACGVVVAALELPPGSPWLLPFVATETGLAVVTASLRVAAGMHFMSDVLAGAALGTLIGVAVPLAHSAFAAPALGTVTPRVAIPLLTVAF